MQWSSYNSIPIIPPYLNDGGEFERSHKSIYPKELTLKKENEGMSDATFLDVETHIEDDIFDYHLYDL